MKTLITGGVRSGKSALAETLAANSGGEAGLVTYIATGPRSNDADWARRIAAHQARRPSTWSTVETTDLPQALTDLRGPALIDCLGTWLTAQLDAVQAWSRPGGQWAHDLGSRVTAMIEAWAACPHDLVAVTNEVGLGMLSEHRSGRIFADRLGLLNQAVAAASDRVLLVTAGLPLTLKEPGPGEPN